MTNRMKNLRNIILSFVLVLCFLLNGTAITALAVGEPISIGQEVKLTISLNGTISSSYVVYVTYDSTKYSIVKNGEKAPKWIGPDTTLSGTLIKSGETYIDKTLNGAAAAYTGTRLTLTPTPAMSLQAETPVVEVVLTAITADTLTASSFSVISTISGTGVTANNLSYEVLGGTSTPDPTGLTVKAVPDVQSGNTIEPGDAFQVAVTAQSDAAYATVQTVLKYNKDKVEFTGAANAAVQKHNATDGTLLLVTKYDNKKPTGAATELANLDFEAKAGVSGEAKFEIVSVVYGLTDDSVDQTDGTGVDGTVTIETPVVQSPVTVISGSKLAPTDYSVIAYKVAETTTPTQGVTYKGAAMTYAPNYGATNEQYFIYIVPDADVDGVVAGDFVRTGAVKQASGNINGGELNIVDAQIAYDFFMGGYTTVTALTIEQRLNADVNGDGQVTIADAWAIQYVVVNGVSFNAVPNQ